MRSRLILLLLVGAIACGGDSSTGTKGSANISGDWVAPLEILGKDTLFMRVTLDQVGSVVSGSAVAATNRNWDASGDEWRTVIGAYGAPVLTFKLMGGSDPVWTFRGNVAGNKAVGTWQHYDVPSPPPITFTKQ